MALQLGLALPTHHLNGFEFKAKEKLEMDLWNNVGGCLDSKKDVNKPRKRSFCQAFDDISDDETSSSPLLSWSPDQPNEDGDHASQNKRSTSSTIDESKGEERRYVVGWPPIHSCRRKLLHGNGGMEVNAAAVKESYGRCMAFQLQVCKGENGRSWHSKKNQSSALSLFLYSQKLLDK